MHITDIHNPWRDALVPASFRNANFHVESGTRQDARRIVVHEFPKKELPYAEDMGRHAIEFTVRGYCITYPFDTLVDLYKRDYRVARDKLVEALEKEGPGMLWLPTHVTKSCGPMMVVCPRYRLTEEQRFGGYCTFDMEFVEFGLAPGAVPVNTIDNLEDLAKGTQKVLTMLLQPIGPPKPIAPYRRPTGRP
jgi:prophage DNA circulation protein